LAESYGQRASAVLLTGMVRDSGGRRTGAQSPAALYPRRAWPSAERPGVPSAVIETGAADLVLPSNEIGRVVGDVVVGGPLPRVLSEHGAGTPRVLTEAGRPLLVPSGRHRQPERLVTPGAGPGRGDGPRRRLSLRRLGYGQQHDRVCEHV
jgi:hypothetical protein